MDHLIQFLGLILFVTRADHIEAIIPRISNQHVVAHQSFIAFRHDTANTTNWPIQRTFIDRHDHLDWDYVVLDGETVRIANPDSPIGTLSFLPRLNDDCCRLVGTVRKKYAELDGTSAAGHVLISSGDAGYAKDGTRIDTVVSMHTSEPLTVIAVKGSVVRSINFKAGVNARVVVGNFPIDEIEHGSPAGSDGAHFREYYRMLTFGFFCRATPFSKDQCTAHENGKTKTPVVRIDKIGIVDLDDDRARHYKHYKFASLRSVEIDCSNTQYP